MSDLKLMLCIAASFFLFAVSLAAQAQDRPCTHITGPVCLRDAEVLPDLTTETSVVVSFPNYGMTVSGEGEYDAATFCYRWQVREAPHGRFGPPQTSPQLWPNPQYQGLATRITGLDAGKHYHAEITAHQPCSDIQSRWSGKVSARFQTAGAVAAPEPETVDFDWPRVCREIKALGFALCQIQPNSPVCANSQYDGHTANIRCPPVDD